MAVKKSVFIGNIDTRIEVLIASILDKIDLIESIILMGTQDKIHTFIRF
jgi:hypothetical protein